MKSTNQLQSKNNNDILSSIRLSDGSNNKREKKETEKENETLINRLGIQKFSR